jgi:phage terminase large subunit
MYGTVLQTWTNKVLRESDGVHPYGKEKPEFFIYPNGARVYVLGMDNPGSVLSGELDYVFVNQAEDLDITDWETLTSRVTGRAGNAQKVGLRPWLGGDCNPGAPTHWILDREKAGSLTRIDSRHEDNPTLYNQDTGEITAQGEVTIATLDALTGVRKQRLRHGKWISAEGAVYEEDFFADIHIVDTIPPLRTMYRAVDFGFTNPFVCLWAGEDEDGRLYVFRELYMSRTIVEDHAKVINRYSDYVAATICDHDTEDRATLERHLKHNPETIAAKKDITAGLDAVRERLKVQPDGKPRLMFLKTMLIERDELLASKSMPVSLLDEFALYVYPKDAAGKTVKEKPVDKDNHGLDALRYLVMNVDGSEESFIPSVTAMLAAARAGLAR